LHLILITGRKLTLFSALCLAFCQIDIHRMYED
jgi:hypothetical protein